MLLIQRKPVTKGQALTIQNLRSVVQIEWKTADPQILNSEWQTQSYCSPEKNFRNALIVCTAAASGSGYGSASAEANRS
jgi:hypothetical protein